MQTNPTLIFEYTLAFLVRFEAFFKSEFPRLKGERVNKEWDRTPGVRISKVIFKIKILESEGTNPHNQPILFC